MRCTNLQENYKWTFSDKVEVNTFAFNIKNILTPNRASNSFSNPFATILKPTRHKSIQCNLFEVLEVINNLLNKRKAPLHYQVTIKMIKQLPLVAVQYTSKMYKAKFKLGFLQTGMFL